MNKKGFVLSETLIVTIFVLVIFTILYNTAVPLLGRYEEISYYDNLDATYDLYHIKKLVTNDANYQTIKGNDYTVLKCYNNTIFDSGKCDETYRALELDELDEVIYIKKGQKQKVINDNNISLVVREYLEYIDFNSDVILLQNDGYVSYLNIMSQTDKIINAAKIKENTTSCKTIVEEDGITYISGTKECIDFNYVWYSGKMWRITAIYPDGTMKLITDNNITSISFGEDVTYYNKETEAKSYMFQWLNEDFLDTLYNYENIIVHDNDIYWNATQTSSVSTKPPETDATMIPTSISPVGLLNGHEYYNSYYNAETDYFEIQNGYLNMGYSWWLLNPISSTSVNVASKYRNLSSSSPSSDGYRYSVRPSIILQSNISLTGNGTKNNPYRILDNLNNNANIGDLLNTRISGEYVKFDENLFRIVRKENDITKLTMLDYVRNPDSSTNPKEVLKQRFSNSGYFGSTKNNSQKDETYGYYWDYYLNNIWFNAISPIYKDMIVDGNFYTGVSAASYKTIVCKDAEDSLNNLVINEGKTNSCSRYTTSDTNKIFVGKVGLLRLGEIFSTQIVDDESSSNTMWLITPYTGYHVHLLHGDCSIGGQYVAKNKFAVRPTIHLKSDVKILSGTGTELDPFVVGL